MMLFQIGEKVVYPNQGVGTIENISSRSFGTRFERFYLLRLNAASMTVMVPFSHVSDVGLRKITRQAEVAKVLEYLTETRIRSKADWKDRFKENSERMRSGSLYEITEVFKCLLVQQNEKTLSFREKKMLDRARHMLITEVQISRGPDGVNLIEKALAKASLALPAAL